MQSLDDHKRLFELSGLISCYLSGTLSEEQEKALKSWLAESGEHQAVFERICAEQTMREKWEHYRNENVQSAFDDFQHRRRRLAFRRGVYRWAACAVLLLTVGAAWWQWRSDASEVSGGMFAQDGTVVDSMFRKPVLTLASGEQMVVLENGVLFQEMSEGQWVKTNREMILQSRDSMLQHTDNYNTIEVPPMCDFHFTLSDGTKVWMNAASSLRYPVKFAADSRSIYVSGEVYLEVAKDSSRPFSVVTDNMRVEVLGTCFNVRAYPHERETKVTLAEGKVAARVGEEKYTLTPGNQLSLEEGSGKVSVQAVDVDDVLAWKRGFYVFKKSNLAEVASTLQSWYDVKIVLKGEVAARTTYTGVVNKEEAIEVFLSRLEKVSEVKCVREGNVVSIQ